MTTIHAALQGARQPSAQYLSVTLQQGNDKPVTLIAPREELRKALIETGGVGRFDLQIGEDPTIHHAIAQKVEKGSIPNTLRHILVQEVRDEDVVRMQVMLRVTALPEAAEEKRAQVLQHKRHLIVKGPLGRLPEYLSVDLSHLPVDGVLKAGEIPLPTGIELVTPSDEELFVVRELVRL